MEPLATRLRDRARQLGLSNAEVGRRAGLSERRYGNYIRGSREPDLATLLRICDVLDLTPNDLLIETAVPTPAENQARSRLLATWSALSSEDAELAIGLLDAVRRNREHRGARK